MTVRRADRKASGHALRANGPKYWVGLIWSDARYYVRQRRLIGLVRSLFWTVGLGYYMELCQVCGGPYPLWRAQSDLYRSVVGDFGGLYCPNCFDRAAGRKGISLQWMPRIWPRELRPAGGLSPEQVISETEWLFDQYEDLNGWAEGICCGDDDEDRRAVWRGDRERAANLRVALAEGRTE